MRIALIACRETNARAQACQSFPGLLFSRGSIASLSYAETCQKSKTFEGTQGSQIVPYLRRTFPLCVKTVKLLELYIRLPSNPLIMKVPFLVLFSFNKESPPNKGEKGITWVPRLQAEAQETTLPDCGRCEQCEPRSAFQAQLLKQSFGIKSCPHVMLIPQACVAVI